MKLYTEEELQSHIAAAVADAVAPLLAQIAKLEEEIARLKKNSSNSSKPPSSDIVKPPKGTGKNPKGGKKRKRGGQRGHPRHERKAFSPEEVTVRHAEFTWISIPANGNRLNNGRRIINSNSKRLHWMCMSIAPGSIATGLPAKSSPPAFPTRFAPVVSPVRD